jgi:hypothetical protein
MKEELIKETDAKYKVVISEIDNTEYAKQVYRKLLYYHENKLPVHFCLHRGGFKNGEILDLNEKKLILVLREYFEGCQPFLLEEIKLESIALFKKREEIENESTRGDTNSE